jgi:hypothetical protein
MLELKVAQRKRAKLKLGMAAPAGGGKTMGALLIAYGIMKEKYPSLTDAELWAKIAIVDSENGSGELYVGTEVSKSRLTIGSYNSVTLTPPFEPDKYSEAIRLCADNAIEVVIIDSTTHLWAGVGGALESQGNIAKRTGNSWTAWREVNPQLNRFVDTMLQTDVHIIATMRSKMDYVQEKDPDTGKTIIRKVGLAPVQRDGMQYEFTAFIDIDSEHQAFGSKDRSGGIIDQKYFVITPQIGRDFEKWLESGNDAPSTILAGGTKATAEQDEIITLVKELGGSKNVELMKILKTFEPSGNPKKINDEATLNNLKSSLAMFKEAQETKSTESEKENK